ncbi:MAG TPA: c-type cytochrome domain-containing protein [Chthonomonadales bacterium]|nr:c-type cytochrome domain-containing protein [Chthonomonadales bacterium]
MSGPSKESPSSCQSVSIMKIFLPFSLSLILVFTNSSTSFVVNAHPQSAPFSKSKIQSPKSTTQPLTYHKDILPLFRAACIGCHGSKNPASGLTLDSYASLMKGGKGGAALIPGNSRESRLMKYLLGTLQPQMPIGGSLKPAEIERIRHWIDAGAIEGVRREIQSMNNKSLRPHVAPPVTALVFGPDGKTLAVGVYKEVQFWDMESRKRVKTWSGHADAVHALAFTRDGKRLAAGGGTPGESGEVKLWDVEKGQEIRTLGEHTDVVNALAFSPDGTKLATASADNTIKLWDLNSGKVLQTLRDHSDAVWGLAWSPDGKFFATCGADKNVKVWDAITAKRLYSITAHGDIIYDVEFSPDGRRLVTAGADKLVRVWNFGAEGSEMMRALTGHTHSVHAATFAPDGKLMATASADRSVKVWTSNDGNNIRTLQDAKDWIYVVRFSPDGKRIVAGTWDGVVLIWNAMDGKLEERLSILP